MRKDKQKALKLRLEGKSYNEIKDILNIPKSTLSGWFTGLELSSYAKARIQKRVYAGTLRGLIKRNKNQTHLAVQRMHSIRKLAKAEIDVLTMKDLRLIGSMLYWAEGYKKPIVRNGKEVTHHAVALTNSDPKLILIFLKFLREVCGVSNDKITADIRIYEHMN